MNVIALVPLGDRDEHLSGALLRFRGEPLLSHAVRGLLHSGCVDRVVVAGPPHNMTAYSASIPSAADTRVSIVAGSADQAESVRSALLACVAQPSDIVLVHDPARPFVPATVVRAVVEEIKAGAAAAVPVEPVTDTIKVVGFGDVIQGTRDRTRLRSVQTPRGYLVGALGETDPADPFCGRGRDVRTVAGHPHAMRLATPFDLAVVEALLTAEGSS